MYLIRALRLTNREYSNDEIQEFQKLLEILEEQNRASSQDKMEIDGLIAIAKRVIYSAAKREKFYSPDHVRRSDADEDIKFYQNCSKRVSSLIKTYLNRHTVPWVLHSQLRSL